MVAEIKEVCVCVCTVSVCVCVCITWCQWGHRRCDSVGTVTAGCWKRLLCVSLNCRQLLLSRAVDPLCSLFIINQIIRASPSHHALFLPYLSQGSDNSRLNLLFRLYIIVVSSSWRQPEKGLSWSVVSSFEHESWAYLALRTSSGTCKCVTELNHGS